MKGPRCCQGSGAASSPSPRSWVSRVGEMVNWLAPSILLALLPKCPACMAGYIALATGIGVSLPIAAYLRMVVAVLCGAWLVFVVVKRVRSVRGWSRGGGAV